MNNIDPDFIDDDQLDSLISNVEVPQGLRDQLKKIPTQRESKKDLASVGNNRRFGIIPIRSSLVVPAITIAAAVLIGFCLFMFWKPGLNRAPIAKENNKNRQNQVGPDSSAEESPPDKLAELKSRMASTNQEMEALIAQSTQERLRADLAQVDLVFGNDLNSNEIRSLITAAAEHSQVSFGATNQTIIKDLSRVIENYPGSRGSSYAKETIDELKRSH